MDYFIDNVVHYNAQIVYMYNFLCNLYKKINKTFTM